jgi:hypothetical protein
MFMNAKSFNQDISSWDVSAGTNFVSGLGHGILLLVGVVCVVVSLDCWSIVVAAAHDILAAGSMVAVLLLTHAILLLSCSWGRASWAETNKQSYDQTQVSQYYCSFLLLRNIIIILVAMMIWNNTVPLLLPHFVHRVECLMELRLSTNRFSIATGKINPKASLLLLMRVMEL